MRNLRANRPGYYQLTEQLTGPVSGVVSDPGTGLLTDPPHVRAIASWPVLSWPFQTRPDLGDAHTDRETFQNGKHLSFCRESAVRDDARRERAHIRVTTPILEEHMTSAQHIDSIATPNAPYVTRRQKRVQGYPVTLILEARDLGNAGWGATDIVRIFARRGIDPLPCPTTVRDWLLGRLAVEERREQQRRFVAQQRAAASGGRLRGKARSPEFKFARVAALREAGLSLNAISKVMTFDFPDDPMSEQRVRYILEVGRWSRSGQSA